MGGSSLEFHEQNVRLPPTTACEEVTGIAEPLPSVPAMVAAAAAAAVDFT